MPPLPWKKGKFSRIVADHLNSAKHGGSLVVETGFPTSLVDLFVKNRDGLKRSSKKKKKDRRSDVEPISGEQFPSICHGYKSPARSLSSPESFYSILTPSPIISPSSSFSSSPTIWRTPPHQSFSGSPRIEFCSIEDENRVADGKGVVLAILKVFFVVALALGTKQFVVGLIISAFFLIFLEFIGKYLCRFLKPCQQAQISVKHFLEQVKGVKRIKNVHIEEKEEEPSMKETGISKPSNHLKPPRGKDMTRTMSNSRSIQLDQEFPIGGKMIHCKSLNWLSEEMDKREETPAAVHIIKDSHKNHQRNGKLKSKIMRLLSLKKKEEIEDPIADSDQKIYSKSRSGRLKSKIKKIVVPSSKKKQQQQQPQNMNGLSDFLSIEEPIVCYSEEQQSSCTSPSRSMSNEDVREDPVSVSTERPMEERRIGKTMRSRCFCFVLLPIILVGLMGGRFWAVGFTLAWCLVWKFTGMLWRASSSSSSC